MEEDLVEVGLNTVTDIAGEDTKHDLLDTLTPAAVGALERIEMSLVTATCAQTEATGF